MAFSIFRGFVFHHFLGGGGCAAQEMIEDKTTGKTFPTTVAFTYQEKEYDLEATGVATRKKLFVKIYSIAHYMQDPEELEGENLFNEIIRSKKAKQFTAQWVRSVGKAKLDQGYRNAFEKNLSQQELSELQPTIDQYLTFFGNVRKNDKQVIRSLPNGTIIVEINGVEKGKINNEQFAQALWSIWFGPHSVVNRDELISQVQIE